MSPEVTQIIEALAKISAPVWDAYVFQTRLIGGLKIIFGTVLLVIMVITAQKSVAMPREERNDDEDLTAKDGWMICAILSLLIGIGLISSGFINLINPVYYAVQTLIGR